MLAGLIKQVSEKKKKVPKKGKTTTQHQTNIQTLLSPYSFPFPFLPSPLCNLEEHFLPFFLSSFNPSEKRAELETLTVTKTNGTRGNGMHKRRRQRARPRPRPRPRPWWWPNQTKPNQTKSYRISVCKYRRYEIFRDGLGRFRGSSPGAKLFFFIYISWKGYGVKNGNI